MSLRNRLNHLQLVVPEATLPALADRSLSLRREGDVLSLLEEAAALVRSDPRARPAEKGRTLAHIGSVALKAIDAAHLAARIEMLETILRQAQGGKPLNTDRLAKLYDRLTPAERLPLIVAASRRGDEAERQRLAHAGTACVLRVPDHFALAQALAEASEMHLLETLELAAQFWQAWGLWGWRQVNPKGTDGAWRSLGLVRQYAYRLREQVHAWERFAAEQHLAPEALLDFMPGYATIQAAYAHAEDLAFTAEEAVQFLRLCGDEDGSIVTAADLLQSLRELVAQRQAWWSGRSR